MYLKLTAERQKGLNDVLIAKFKRTGAKVHVLGELVEVTHNGSLESLLEIISLGSNLDTYDVFISGTGVAINVGSKKKETW